jgi:hypothetical protein
MFKYNIREFGCDINVESESAISLCYSVNLVDRIHKIGGPMHLMSASKENMAKPCSKERKGPLFSP